MRAHALRSWWEAAGGVAKVYHPMESSFFGYRLGCSAYNLIQKTVPRFHYVYFHLLEFAALHRGPRRIMGSDEVLAKFSEFSPDLVVSMHAHLNHGYFDLLKNEIGNRLRFVVYSGELGNGSGFSRHWINPENDLFAGPTSECCEAAESRGMPAEKCLVAGPLLRKSFYHQHYATPNEILFQKYKLLQNRPVYLLCTGANGVNNHEEIIRAFVASCISCNVIALCGVNKSLQMRLSNGLGNDKVRVVPLDTIDDKEMMDLMNLADWAFARPGAGVTTEAMVVGCPMIFDLTGGVMPQEMNNLNYWKKHAPALLTCNKPRLLPQIVSSNPTIPRLRMPIGREPEVLLAALNNLVP